MHLTRRQKEILDFVRHQVERDGYAPTLQEIGDHLRLSSPATVYSHIGQLVRKGYLRKAPHQARGIQLVDTEPVRTVEVPLLGHLTAGQPMTAILEPENVYLPPDFVGRRPTYALRARGSSMIDEHICDGDCVIVEERSTADDGETVIALGGDDRIIVKKFYRDGDRVRLQPANPVLEPILLAANEVRIQGVVIGVMRRYAAPSVAPAQ